MGFSIGRSYTEDIFCLLTHLVQLFVSALLFQFGRENKFDRRLNDLQKRKNNFKPFCLIIYHQVQGLEITTINFVCWRHIFSVSFPLIEGWSNYDPWAKSGPPYPFVRPSIQFFLQFVYFMCKSIFRCLLFQSVFCVAFNILNTTFRRKKLPTPS